MILSSNGHSMKIREETREKYSDRFKTDFDSFEDYIEHKFYKTHEPKEIKDYLEKMELDQLRREYRNKTVFINGEPLQSFSNLKNQKLNPLSLQ